MATEPDVNHDALCGCPTCEAAWEQASREAEPQASLPFQGRLPTFQEKAPVSPGGASPKRDGSPPPEGEVPFSAGLSRGPLALGKLPCFACSGTGDQLEGDGHCRVCNPNPARPKTYTPVAEAAPSCGARHPTWGATCDLPLDGHRRHEGSTGGRRAFWVDHPGRAPTSEPYVGPTALLNPRARR